MPDALFITINAAIYIMLSLCSYGSLDSECEKKAFQFTVNRLC